MFLNKILNKIFK